MTQWSVLKCSSALIFVWLLLHLSTACTHTIQAVPEDLITSPDPDVRRVAAIQIGENRLRQYLDVLLLRVEQDPDPLVRSQCATAVQQIGIENEEVRETLIRVLQNDPNPLVQQSVLEAIHAFEIEQAGDDVAARLENADAPDVRQAAARVLGTIGRQRHYPALIKGLRDEVPRVQNSSLDSLRKITDLDGPLDSNWWEQRLLETNS